MKNSHDKTFCDVCLLSPASNKAYGLLDYCDDEECKHVIKLSGPPALAENKSQEAARMKDVTNLTGQRRLQAQAQSIKADLMTMAFEVMNTPKSHPSDMSMPEVSEATRIEAKDEEEAKG